jgi:hypothetical protein
MELVGKSLIKITAELPLTIPFYCQFFSSFKKTSCDSKSAIGSVRSLCLGAANCSIPINQTFLGTPSNCSPSFSGPFQLAVQVSCSPKNVNRTFWNFDMADPYMEDFMNSTKGRSTIINFSTIPQWMWLTPEPVPFPKDPYVPAWNYEQGTVLRDPSFQEVGDYYARLLSWYTKGGFTDEYGMYHSSGHHYHIPIWEVRNIHYSTTSLK